MHSEKKRHNAKTVDDKNLTPGGACDFKWGRILDRAREEPQRAARCRWCGADCQ